MWRKITLVFIFLYCSGGCAMWHEFDAGRYKLYMGTSGGQSAEPSSGGGSNAPGSGRASDAHGGTRDVSRSADAGRVSTVQRATTTGARTFGDSGFTPGGNNQGAFASPSHTMPTGQIANPGSIFSPVQTAGGTVTVTAPGTTSPFKGTQTTPVKTTTKPVSAITMSSTPVPYDSKYRYSKTFSTDMTAGEYSKESVLTKKEKPRKGNVYTEKPKDYFGKKVGNSRYY
jgi:hypothetical protein